MNPRTSPPTLHRAASRWLSRVVLAAALLLGAGVGVEVEVAAQPSGSPVEAAQGRYEDLKVRLGQLRQRRQSQEKAYTQLTRRIAEAKRAGASEALLGGIQLDSLLAEGRSLANDLNALQEEIRQVEGLMETSRQEILAVYQGQIDRLERQLLTAQDAPTRAQAIQSINTLKRERHAYTATSAPTPDLDLARLPSLQSLDSADPEELQAAAAELDDTESKLRGHIETLNEQIDRLERERRLRQKAQDFAEEESFFDETSRNRRIARTTTRIIGPGADSGASGKGGAATAGGGTANEPTRNDQETTTNAEPNAVGAPGGADNDANFDGAAAPEAQDDRAAEDPGVQSPPGEGEALVDTGGGIATPGIGAPQNVPNIGLPSDPFATPGVIVKADAQLDRIGGPEAGAGESLEGQVNRLKREKERLKKQAEELRRRSVELKRRANEL